MDSARFVIVGAGLAGMATAYALTRRGEPEVLILEKENLPGLHSSGRNAAMIRQVVSEKNILKLAREGANFFNSQAEDWEKPVPFTKTGSILVARGERWLKLCTEAEKAGELGVELKIWKREKVNTLVPCTEGGNFDSGVFCSGDGVTDTDRLINGFYQAAKARGAKLLTGCEVQHIEVKRNKIQGIRTSQGIICAETVVNAAGPWAAAVGKMAGAVPIILDPMRRHLFYTGALHWIDPRWPFVWDVGEDVYFRPESAGLLLSPCDETKAEPGIPPVDHQAQDLLADKLSRSFPRLLDIPIAKSWAGLRTFTPDRLFVIGWDPFVEGFYWVAGLGGHGVTTSPSAGNLAAGELLSGKTAADSPFSPSRFL